MKIHVNRTKIRLDRHKSPENRHESQTEHGHKAALFLESLCALAGTWASVSEAHVSRIAPGCSLESMDNSPVHWSSAPSGLPSSMEERESWCRRVLRELAEAHSPERRKIDADRWKMNENDVKSSFSGAFRLFSALQELRSEPIRHRPDLWSLGAKPGHGLVRLGPSATRPEASLDGFLMLFLRCSTRCSHVFPCFSMFFS